MAMAGRDKSDWINNWKENKTGWHLKEINPLLEKYVNNLVVGRESCRVFFPLCGKAVDMKWLADMGHTVVGVELVDIPIKQFFQEYNVEYDVSPVEGVSDAELYKSKDGKLLIYKANLFAVPRETLGKFDAIWDRGALVAINKEDRIKFVDLMVSCMAPECKYLLVVMDYDPDVMPGPPHCIPDAEVHRLYATQAIQHLKTENCLEDRWRQRGHSWMTKSLFLITPK